MGGPAQFTGPADGALTGSGASPPGQVLDGTDPVTSPNPIVRLPEPDTGQAARAPVLAALAAFLTEAERLALTWARDRSLRPGSVCGISIAISLAAAAWFTAGLRSDSLYGTAALWLGYLVAKVGSAKAGEATAQPRNASVGHARAAIRTLPAAAGAWRSRVRPGAADWLGAVGWWLAECLVYAGLAIGAIAGGSTRMWPVAIALIGLIGVRQMIGACTTGDGNLRDDAPGFASSVVNIVGSMPTGARVLLIGVVAPIWGPRAALLALLDWAVVAVIFSVADEVRKAGPVPSTVRFLRDDGGLARVAGRLVRGNLLPLPPAVLGLAAVCTLAVLGLRNLPGVLVLGPAVVMLLAAPGSSSDHAGRLDWLVPALLLGAQVVYIASVGPAVGVPSPVTFALCVALLLRYVDLASPGRPVWLARQRQPGLRPPGLRQPGLRQPGQAAAECGSWLGWEGRLLLLGLGAAVGIATFAYVALTAYLGVLVGAKIVASGAAPWKEYGSDRRGSGGRG